MSFNIGKLDFNSKEYYSIPFWSWNDKLETDKLTEQIRWMHKNNINGFFMHARSGLITEYMSEEWMDCIKKCADEAEKLGMQAWAYDENGWPSGFAGGKLLEDKENHDRYLEFTMGEYDPTALVSYIVTENQLIRAYGEQNGECMNVYERYSTSTADVLNPDVVEKFIKLTHEKYKTVFGNDFSDKLEGFFTDEPQYYRWGMPYTPAVRKYFKEVLNEDILDGLGLLFLKKDGYRRFRYQYWSAMQHLLVNGFAKKIYEWCDNNGVKFTGHFIEEETLYGQMWCCAGIMPLYEYEHIPGIDLLGRYNRNSVSARQVSSVAAQLGKKKVLCEMYAGCGWDVTPRELKRLTEYMYMNGVNITCQHLLPYSEKCNRIHDYPAHYSEINPWVKHYFDKFNDYFNKLGTLLAEYPENVCVAVLHPLRSAYFDYDREREDDGFGISELDDALDTLVRRLEDSGINYHFLDETLLAKYGKIDGKKIICGKCSYDILIIPKCYTMDVSTERLLKQYVTNNGKIYLYSDKPTYLEWNPYNYDYLKSNVTWDEIEETRPIAFSCSGGELCTSFRKKFDDEFIMMLNKSETEVSNITLELPEEFHSLLRINLENGRETLQGAKFSLKPGESAILVPSKEEINDLPNIESVGLQGPYRVISCEDNYLVIDSLSYSFDGKIYSKPCGVPMAFRELLEKRYCGTLYLKYAFNVETIPEKIKFKVNSDGVEKMYLNNSEVAFSEKGEGEFSNITAGTNEFVLKKCYKQGENVYHVLFGDNITESLKNCLVYDSEIDPLILSGDFGVKAAGGFESSCGAVICENEFKIVKRKNTVEKLCTDGYTFFAGKIILETELELGEKNTILTLPGRWHAAEIEVNDISCGLMLMRDNIDISKAVKPGINKVRISLVVGNRNLYGPHHYKPEPEPFMQGPDMFEFNDTDKPGNKDNYTDKFSFIEAL